MGKLTVEQWSELRSYIRSQLEGNGDLKKGEQSRLAETYAVSKSRINQMVQDERERLRNPVAWEWKRAKQRGEKVNFIELMERFKDHPAFRNTKSE